MKKDQNIDFLINLEILSFTLQMQFGGKFLVLKKENGEYTIAHVVDRKLHYIPAKYIDAAKHAKSYYDIADIDADFIMDNQESNTVTAV